MIYLLVTGSRDLTDIDLVWDALDAYIRVPQNARALTLIVGDCPTGADHFAQLWAKNRGIKGMVYAANWDAWGKGAGPIRNQAMVDNDPDVVLAFYKTGARNRGSTDCVKRARAADIPVREFWEQS